MPATRNDIVPYTSAAVTGVVLWAATSLLTGRREPWDASLYWLLAYPLALVAAGALGRRHPERPWRWAVTLFEAQFIAMCVRNGELGNLWPMGMIAFAVIALPAVFVARAAARRATAQDG